MTNTNIKMRKVPININLKVNITRELKIRIYTAIILIKLAAWVLGGTSKVEYVE